MHLSSSSTSFTYSDSWSGSFAKKANKLSSHSLVLLSHTIRTCHPFEKTINDAVNKMQNVEEDHVKSFSNSYQHNGGSSPAAPPARTQPARAPAVDPSSAAASSVAGSAALRR